MNAITLPSIPSTDPATIVFKKDGTFFREVAPSAVPFYRSFLASQLYLTLVDRGLLARQEDVSGRNNSKSMLIIPAQSQINSGSLRFWSFSTLVAAAKKWLILFLYLVKNDLRLCDGHLGNFLIFGKDVPIFSDLGSILPGTGPDKFLERQVLRFFVAESLLPLEMIKEGGASSALGRVAIEDAISNGPLRAVGEPIIAHALHSRQLEDFNALIDRDFLGQALPAAFSRVQELERAVPSVTRDVTVSVERQASDQSDSVLIFDDRSDPCEIDLPVTGSRLATILGAYEARYRGSGLDGVEHFISLTGHLLNRIIVKTIGHYDTVILPKGLGSLAHQSPFIEKNVLGIFEKFGIYRCYWPVDYRDETGVEERLSAIWSSIANVGGWYRAELETRHV